MIAPVRVQVLAAWVGCAACLMGCHPGSPYSEDTSKKTSDNAKQAALTPGGVKMNIIKGKTTQHEVLEAMGPPDLVTHKDGVDVWTYDKTSYEYFEDKSYFTVLLAGRSGDRVTSTSRSTLLVLYFDTNDVVSDYRLSAIKY